MDSWLLYYHLHSIRCINSTPEFQIVIMKYITYGAYNLVYQGASLFLLFYASSFINERFIPDNLYWENGKPREDLTTYTLWHFAILVIEVVLLTFLIYYVNKLYLGKVTSTTIPIKIATWTAALYFVLTVIIILIAIYPNLK